MVSPHKEGPDADTTLGGYLEVHSRPPAFEGVDGHPYTVSIEVEQVADLLEPFVGYLVFPRWAQNGVGIVGHVETPVLWTGKGSAEVQRAAELLTLLETKQLLDEAIRDRHDDDKNA